MSAFRSPYDVAAFVGAHLTAALDAAGIPVSLGSIPVAQGVVTDCCPGVLFVAPLRAFRVIPGTWNEVQDEPCMMLLAVELGVQVWRCIPTLGDNGEPPDPQADADAARAILDDDAEAMWTALTGPDLIEPDLYRGRVDQTWSIPQGGCASTDMLIQLALGQERWCKP